MSGTLCILGVGPGDPELMTLKAARLLRAAPVVAYFARRGRPGRARAVVEGFLARDATELRLEYPFTTEVALADPAYAAAMTLFYDDAAASIAARLADGDVALLCEGDPFFYGSAMYIHDRLAEKHALAVVPGVPAMAGAWAGAGLPMAHGDDVLTVLPGTLDEDSLVRHLTAGQATVIMKLGRNLPKIRAALARADRARDAVYVEHATTPAARTLPLAALDTAPAPYFALLLVPGRRQPR